MILLNRNKAKQLDFNSLLDHVKQYVEEMEESSCNFTPLRDEMIALCELLKEKIFIEQAEAVSQLEKSVPTSPAFIPSDNLIVIQREIKSLTNKRINILSPQNSKLLERLSNLSRQEEILYGREKEGWERKVKEYLRKKGELFEEYSTNKEKAKLAAKVKQEERILVIEKLRKRFWDNLELLNQKNVNKTKKKEISKAEEIRKEVLLGGTKPKELKKLKKRGRRYKGPLFKQPERMPSDYQDHMKRYF